MPWCSDDGGGRGMLISSREGWSIVQVNGCWYVVQVKIQPQVAAASSPWGKCFLHGQWGLVGVESAARATSAVGEAAPSRRRGSCVIRKLQTNPRKESENQVSDVGSWQQHRRYSETIPVHGVSSLERARVHDTKILPAVPVRALNPQLSVCQLHTDLPRRIEENHLPLMI